jgi:hypothetical protein
VAAAAAAAVEPTAVAASDLVDNEDCSGACGVRPAVSSTLNSVTSSSSTSSLSLTTMPAGRFHTASSVAAW